MFRDLPAGIMHFGIFWGFVLLTIGTANIVTGGLIQAVALDPVRRRCCGSAVTAMQNVVAVIVLVCVGVGDLAPGRHAAGAAHAQPPRLDILLLIGAVVADRGPRPGVRGRGARPDRRARSSRNAVGGAIADAGVGPGRCPGAVRGLLVGPHRCWSRVFLCYLPFGKHLHIATAIPNIALRKVAPRGELPAMDLEAEDATFGIRTVADLDWKDLLDGFTCTECGRCQQACPAWNTGKPLNPKTFIMGIRHEAVEAEAGLPLIPNSPTRPAAFGLDDTLQREAVARPLVDTAIPYEAVWDCLTCGACVEACPVTIEHVDKIVGHPAEPRPRGLALPPGADGGVQGHGERRQPVGPAAVGAARLGEGPAVPGPDRRRTSRPPGELDALEVLYWVGCAAAFDDRNRRVARAVATCLDAAGVSFAVLGQEESCTGDPARRMGNEYVFQILAGQNIETLNRYRMGERTIVTACPHCFNTIGNEYGAAGRLVHDPPPLASTSSDLVAAGRLALGRGRPARAVDHVPRLVLPGPLQRGDRGAARRARLDPGRGAGRDGEQRPPDVLLRGGRRPDVDGGDARDAGQRRAHAPGARDGGLDRRHGVPVLHGHAPRRPHRRRTRRAARTPSAPRTSASCSRPRSRRPGGSCPRAARSRWCERRDGRQRGARDRADPADRAARDGEP